MPLLLPCRREARGWAKRVKMERYKYVLLADEAGKSLAWCAWLEAARPEGARRRRRVGEARQRGVTSAL